MDMIKGWRPSHGINANAGLFEEGTDPDDVFQGQLGDGWLLSAISIVAASGGVGDSEVDELVDSIFLTKTTSPTGLYQLRLYKNAQWETVVLDDYFPVLDIKYKATKCAGAAFAYSEDMSEIWVPLIEKAFAKYYGSYAALEQGYVHHALADLTGGDAEEVFLAEAARGANKMRLWRNILKWRANHFLMGAGTIVPNSNDRELMDSGLVFGAAYVVYDAQQVDGHKLIKLRNPPGDHGEWQGDWGDKSPLWTQRLKMKLDWTDEDDGCFWMSFDDFCAAFRSLYLCRWFDPRKWHKEVQSGWWKGPLAAGLPTHHNPFCKLHLNYQYSVYCDRPTDVSFQLKQSLPDVALDNTAVPVAMYLVANSGDVDPEKVMELNEKRARDREAILGTAAVAREQVAAAGAGAGAGAGGAAATAAAEEAEVREALAFQAALERQQIIASLGRETGISGSTKRKAERVRALMNTNVVCHTGAPVRERELRMSTTLEPGHYTLLVAPYATGMEGPFTLTLHSNFNVDMETLWPPVEEVVEREPTNMRERIEFKLQDWRNRAHKMFRTAVPYDPIQEKRAEDEKLEAEEAILAMEEAAEEAEEATATAKDKASSMWVEQYDESSQRSYWYNIATGESRWDEPGADEYGAGARKRSKGGDDSDSD
jgi:hypothetical protein